jgi:Domain of unknown function (DUF3883)
MASVVLSPGRLTALWLVLRTTQKLGGDGDAAEITRYAARSSLRSGALPVTDGLRLAREGGFLRERGGRLVLEPLGLRALDLATEDEPPPDARRLFMSVLLLRDPPPWVAYWQGRPESIDLVVPERERRSLEDAYLFPPRPDTDLLAQWAFWRALSRVPLMDETAAQRKAIGNVGEELTIAYERERLRAEGFADLGAQVRWLARESDAYGFDVLSFAGRSAHQPDTQIAVEVKSSSLPASTYFRLFLSAHEWETAATLGDRYVIHVWTGADPGPPPQGRGPILVRPSDLARHLPSDPDCDDPCRWQTAEIHLQLGSNGAAAP